LFANCTQHYAIKSVRKEYLERNFIFHGDTALYIDTVHVRLYFNSEQILKVQPYTLIETFEHITNLCLKTGGAVV